MFIPRILENQLRELVKGYPIVSVTGPRQSGKTTLLKEMFPDYRYVSLEYIDNQEFATQDPRGFLEQYDKYVIIDEAQRVPQLFNYLQGKVDTDKIMGQYIISGSQNFLLSERITQSLAGRVAITKLLPFDLSELKQAQLLETDSLKYLYQGFYPAVYERGLNPAIYYNNYLETYIERDVRSIINVKDLSLFQLFLKLCAGRAGQLLNINALAADCGIAATTARSWLGILEASFIIHFLPPFFNNINKRLVKSKKLYFWDTGLLSFLLEIREKTQLETHYLKGNIFENLVISDMQKTNQHQLLLKNLYFYRDSNQNEVDVMIQNSDKFHLLEIKSGKTIVKEFFKGMEAFERNTPQLVDTKTLVYGGTEEGKRFNTTILGWSNASQVFI